MINRINVIQDVRLAGETLAEMPKLPPYQAPTINIICRYLSAVLNEHKNDPNNLNVSDALELIDLADPVSYFSGKNFKEDDNNIPRSFSSSASKISLVFDEHDISNNTHTISRCVSFYLEANKPIVALNLYNVLASHLPRSERFMKYHITAFNSLTRGLNSAPATQVFSELVGQYSMGKSDCKILLDPLFTALIRMYSRLNQKDEISRLCEFVSSQNIPLYSKKN